MTGPNRKASSDIGFLCRAFKAPSMAHAVKRLAEQAPPSKQLGVMKSSSPPA